MWELAAFAFGMMFGATAMWVRKDPPNDKTPCGEFNHRFEPRHDVEDNYATQTYVRDICPDCGLTRERGDVGNVTISTPQWSYLDATRTPTAVGDDLRQ